MGHALSFAWKRGIVPGGKRVWAWARGKKAPARRASKALVVLGSILVAGVFLKGMPGLQRGLLWLLGILALIALLMGYALYRKTRASAPPATPAAARSRVRASSRIWKAMLVGIGIAVVLGVSLFTATPKIVSWLAPEAKQTQMQFCWSKPDKVVGTVPTMRSRCFPVASLVRDATSIKFKVAFTRSNGRHESAEFFMDLAKKRGTWRNTGSLEGHGVWERQPSPGLSDVAVFGKMRDATEDNRWVNFWISSLNVF
ncbi:MAG: hypothetical protein KBD16_01195 [Candidatus Pacebacteria bacterium]|nr:hypothetical protein [Candidatus Paceibacterota bacterium]